MKKLAVIGFGRIGRMHTLNIAQAHHGLIKTVVVNSYSPTQEAWLAEKGLAGIAVTKDLDATLCDPEIGSILIAASTSAHVEIVEKALLQRKHIFCEKPISQEAQTLKRLCEKIEEAGIIFQVGFNRRFDHQYRRVYRAMADGQLGKLHMVKVKNRDPKRPPYDFIPRSGGMVLDFNTHDFDMVRFVSGEKIEEVCAMGANLVDPKIGELGDIDTIAISLRLSNQAIAVIDSSRETNYGYDQELEVFGQHGSVKAMNVREDQAVLSLKGKVSIANPMPDFQTRYYQAYQQQTLHFINTVDRSTVDQNEVGKQQTRSQQQFPTPGIRDALAAVCVAEAVNKSLHSRSIEKVVYL